MSLLAKKVGMLEEYRGRVTALEKEIAEMLNLAVPKRTYQKRTPELPDTENDDDEPRSEGEYIRVGRRRQGQRTSPKEEAEILRLAHEGKNTGPDIVRATGRSLATVNRVLHDANLKLSELRGIGKSARAIGTGETATDPAGAETREKKILALRKNKMPQDAIAKTLRIDRKEVRDVLKKYGQDKDPKIITDAQRALVLKMKAEGKHKVTDILKAAGIGATAYYRIINGAK